MLRPGRLRGTAHRGDMGQGIRRRDTRVQSTTGATKFGRTAQRRTPSVLQRAPVRAPLKQPTEVYESRRHSRNT